MTNRVYKERYSLEDLKAMIENKTEEISAHISDIEVLREEIRLLTNELNSRNKK